MSDSTIQLTPEELQAENEALKQKIAGLESPPKPDQPKEVSRAFFRSTNSALVVIVGSPAAGSLFPESVRFVPYMEPYGADEIKVGYLSSKDPRVIERLRADSSCTEIDKKEFKAKTDPEDPKVRQLPI